MVAELTVVLIDDHTLFRNGLADLLARHHVTVLGMTDVPTEALPLVHEHEPDIVLLDLRMPETSGLETLRSLKTELPEQLVVILTTSAEEHDLLEALRLGANGYLLKDMEPEQFVMQLRQAVQGETVVAGDLAGLLARAAVARDQPKPQSKIEVYQLTPRERDILQHMAQGQSNKDIARSLGIVDGTVKLHVRAVLKKLGVQSRVQAAVLAVSEGLFDEESPLDPRG